MTQLVVAVETEQTDSKLVAAAVVYGVNTAPPSFIYSTKTGDQRIVGLEHFGRLSVDRQAAIQHHVKQNALSWVRVIRYDDDRALAISLAVARALERLRHVREYDLDRRYVSVHFRGRCPLESNAVGGVKQNVYLPEDDVTWYLRAASVIAKPRYMT